MNKASPAPHLRTQIMAAVRTRGPLTFTQIVHATRANRGSVWRSLKQLEQRGHVRTITHHGRIHYVATQDTE